MKSVCLIILLLGSLAIMSCSMGEGEKEQRYLRPTWSMMQSPLTGRYYEVATFYGEITMSEVTQAEYDKYISKGK